MKKIRLIYTVLLAAVLAGCNDEKFAGQQDYVEGKPATVNLTMVVPTATRVTSRAIDPDLESEIHQLALIMFEKNSGRKEFIDLTGNLTALEPTPLAGRTYHLTNPVTTLSGLYELYAVANWASTFGCSTADLANMDKGALKSLLFENTTEEYRLSGANGFPMSRYMDNFLIEEGENVLTGDRTIHLTRGVAHIEFVFENGPATSSGLQPNFVPQSYSVYRIPAEMTAIDLDGKLSGTANTFDVLDVAITNTTDEGKTSFDFFMLENYEGGVTPPGEAANQSDREKWDDTGMENTDKGDMTKRVFTNAPQNATFVVVEGQYSGPASKDDGGNWTADNFTGTVRYVIHLGNFNTSNGGSMNNYNVNRNEHHTYTVTVKGANSIYVNADVKNADNLNYATEGVLTQMNKAEVDAHYTKVMLRIPKMSMLNDGTDQIQIKTPRNGYSTTIMNVSDLAAAAASRAGDQYDYKWIQFQKPSADNVTNNTFPAYAGIDLTTGECLNQNSTKWGYVTDLVANPSEYAYEDGDYWYTAAFIDEYTYTNDTDLAYSTWCGYMKPHREMVLNPTDHFISDNLQSETRSGSAFHVDQKPIATPFDITGSAMDDETFNPFGMEQVEEPSTGRSSAETPALFTSAVTYDTNLAVSDRGSDSNEHNGQENTAVMFSGLLTDDGTKGHYYADASQNGAYVHKPYSLLSEAIVAHNRDFNGDGTISEDELRWYVPTLPQYVIVQAARSIFNNDLRIYKSSMRNYSGTASDQAFPRYLTSSANPLRVMWQETGCNGSGDHLTQSWFIPENNVRFMRNIGRAADAYKNDYTANTTLDAENHVITVNNRRIARLYDWTEAYPIHGLSDEANMLPLKLEYYYAKKGSSSTGYALRWVDRSTNAGSWFNTNIINKRTDKEAQIAAMTAAALSAYNTDNDTEYTELPDGWRIPNMMELQVLFLSGVTMSLTGVENAGYPGEQPEESYKGGALMSCTYIDSDIWTTNRSQSDKRIWPGMIIDNILNHPNTGGISCTGMGVILVRDYQGTTDSETETASVKAAKSRKATKSKARRIANRR